MEQMTITNAQFTSERNDMIKCTINDVEMHIPIAPGNRHYDEIMKQVEAGDLTIADAD